MKGRVLDGSGPSGVGLNIKSDAMWVGTKSENTDELAPTRGDVTRLRLILQGDRTFEAGNGATFTPSAEIGLRHDGGDAETGTRGRGRSGTALHRRGRDDRGAGAHAHCARGVGIQGMGGERGYPRDTEPDGSRPDALHRPRMGANRERRRAAMVCARRKGVRKRSGVRGVEPVGDWTQATASRLPGNRGVLTPYAGLTLGDAGNRTVRAGTRWQFGPDVVVGLEATRQTSDAGEGANEVRLRAALRF